MVKQAFYMDPVMGPTVVGPGGELGSPIRTQQVGYAANPPAGENPKDCEAARRAKAPLSVVPTAVLAYASMQMHNGKGKYGGYNFRGTGIRFSVYYEAILRHAIAMWNGEEFDEEGLPNIAGLAANVAILCDATAHGFLIDDRPPKVDERSLWDKVAVVVQANNVRNADRKPIHYDYRTPTFQWEQQ